MSIALIRVDDRLIHGQVLMGWTRAAGVTHVVVADDGAAADPMQVSMMKMAAPSGIGVSILGEAEAAEKLLGDTLAKESVLVLVRGPEALWRLREAGISFQKVNVGNVRSGQGRTRLTKEVHASIEELAVWRQLDEAGVRLEAQWLPNQSRTDFNDVLRRVP